MGLLSAADVRVVTRPLGAVSFRWVHGANARAT